MATAPPTRVVNLRDEAFDVYIGRAGRGQDGYFGNPYKLTGEELRGATTARYEAYFLERVERNAEFRRRVQELRSRRLGCFCAPARSALTGQSTPRICHGQVIAAYADKLA